MLHFLCAGHLDLSFENPAAGHKVTPYFKHGEGIMPSVPSFFMMIFKDFRELSR